MAFFTGQSRMRPQQGKTTNVMVKLNFADPAIRIMAIIAIFTLLTFVGIIVFVAAVAIFWNFVLQFSRMTVLTTYVFMFTNQWEVSFRMIK